MENQFKVDENGLTSDGYRILPKDSIKSMYISRAIIAVVAAVVLYAAIAFTDAGKEPWPTVLLALFVILVVYEVVAPVVFYKRYRYRIDDDKVDIRRGIITITHEMVPIERIHQVDVSHGPINRAFGLADITVTTAGGTVTLQYLDSDEAEGIAAKLNENVVKLLKDRV